MEVQGRFDTGSPGSLALTAESRQALEASGHLQQVGSGYALTLDYNGVTLVMTAPQLSMSKQDSISMGYSFLRDYRTVWNFKKRTLTLLK